MNIDLTNVAPMIREKICRQIRQIISDERYILKNDIENWMLAGVNSESEALIEMKKWLNACDTVDTTALQILKHK